MIFGAMKEGPTLSDKELKPGGMGIAQEVGPLAGEHAGLHPSLASTQIPCVTKNTRNTSTVGARIHYILTQGSLSRLSQSLY